jgi:4-hydroxybenzoate polyprenyltransferase
MTASAPLPDASSANWVDRRAPEALKPWLKLGRFDRPVGVWLLMLPGWQGVALASAQEERWPSLWLLLLIFVGAAVMRAAGCAYNDIVDRDLDRQVARTANRPVASGRIGVRAAWAYVVSTSLVGLLVLLSLNPSAILIGAASIGLVAAYPFMKRITWWPQLWLGLTFNWGALVGFAAAQGGATGWDLLGVSLFTTPDTIAAGVAAGGLQLPALLLYASGVFWTLGYDTIYALQDLEDDALAGVKSSARRLGRHARRGVGVFYAVSVGLLLWTPAAVGPGLILGLLAYATHLALQVDRLKDHSPDRALRIFKSNVVAGLLLFAGLVLAVWRP